MVAIAFILPFSYALAGNYLLFGRISPMTVDGGFDRQLIISQIVEGRAPHPADRPGGYPEPIGAMLWELRFPYEKTHRDNLVKKTLKLGVDMAMKDPIRFLRVRLNKAWYIWEKHNLFIFSYEKKIVEVTAYTANSFLLIFAVAGIILFWRKRRLPHQRIFLFTAVALILYTSAAHMISDGEERFSLPAYPILFVFAGYAVATGNDWVKKRTGRMI
jgi:hypothetical protein